MDSGFSKQYGSDLAFVVDYSSGTGYSYIPVGSYSLNVVIGKAVIEKPEDEEFDGGYDPDYVMRSFTAKSKPVTVKVKTVNTPKAVITPVTPIKVSDPAVSKIPLAIRKSSNTVKGSVTTFDLEGIGSYMGLMNDTKGGVPNKFAEDYTLMVDDGGVVNLVFTGRGHESLLDAKGWISSKDASKNSMLTGYVPYAYQSAFGYVNVGYAKVTIKAPKGLTAQKVD